MIKRITRRDFLKLSGAGTLAMYAATDGKFLMRALAQIPGGSLPPGDVSKYTLPLVKPPAMPSSKGSNKNKDKYKIAVRQFQQRILPPPHPETTVWSYGSTDFPGTVAQGGTFNYPAFTIEATWNKSAQVQWFNELVDANGNFLPHLLPIDQTLHWANPPGGIAGRDRRPTFATTPGPYTGPVPMVTHVHGAHTNEDSDGYAEAWYLPNALNIPAGYATTGTFYDYFTNKYAHFWAPGTASFIYPNDQRATTLWYHDHTLGMTRANVYAGPAGFWLIRGGPDDAVLDSRDGSPAFLPGLAPGVGDDPLGEYGEIPIVVQDRSFNLDGSLFYPDTRAFFDEYGGPYIPDTPVSPIWNPEFFGNMMVVNGFTWPYLDVEQRRYRFRLLNGCNSRFLILQFSDPRVEVWQIGAEGGFLPAPVRLNDYPYPGTSGGATVLMALAERADVIVDFTNVPVGTEVLLLNLGPDEPFGGGAVGGDFDPSDPDSTGQVMQFRVGPATSPDLTTPPQYLQLPATTPLGTAGVTRHLSLNEEAFDDGQGFEGPVAALLGTWNPNTSQALPLLWSDLITENPALGATEEWAVYNVTEDAHPIHIHLVQFEVLGREAIGGGPSVAGSNNPLPWETGFKDTVISYPGEVTRVKMKFDYPGFYVWHCHIVEHEDNEMMRPFHVGPIPPDAPAQ
ncbi:MAG TPA: multicopper oxidase [Anaerolineales bacterium]|nr:multicopper oxidase [Anaerolineales bacterium]